MELSIEIDPARSLQGQIFEQLRDLIVTEGISCGARLPSSRELSALLSVSRNTVKGVYDKLTDQGYIYSQVGSGTYVCTILPERTIGVNPSNSQTKIEKELSTVDLNLPEIKQEIHQYPSKKRDFICDFQLERTDPHSFPTKTWRRLINNRLTTLGSSMTRYGEPMGLEDLRTAIATRIGSTRGILVDPSQVFIVTGIQQGLNIVSQLFVRKGTGVLIEAPGYTGAKYLFQNYGAKLIPVPVNENGIVLEKLPEKGVSLAFITPSRQYPMGSVMSIKDRKALIEWAARVGSYIIETDYDSDFRYEGAPLPAIKTLDNHECVIYLGSFSKTLGPGLRLGYMVLPPNLVDGAISCKKLLDYGMPWLDQAVLADFIASGSYDNYLKRLRSLYRNRRDRLIKELTEKLGRVELYGVESGTHLVWKLPEWAPDVHQLKKLMLKKNVGVYNLWHNSICNWEHAEESDRLLLLGYGAISEENISEGVDRIINELKQHSL
jgi:GntR family transcriptional regulator/MocR family aminotransferase